MRQTLAGAAAEWRVPQAIYPRSSQRAATLHPIWLAALLFFLGACLGLAIGTLVAWLRDRDKADDDRHT